MLGLIRSERREDLRGREQQTGWEVAVGVGNESIQREEVENALTQLQSSVTFVPYFRKYHISKINKHESDVLPLVSVKCSDGPLPPYHHWLLHHQYSPPPVL